MDYPKTLLFTSENPNVEIQLWNFVNGEPVTKLDIPIIPINSEVTVDLPINMMGDNRLCIVPINGAVIDTWESDALGTQGWKNWLFEVSQQYLDWETFILDTSRYNNLSNTTVTFNLDVSGGASETTYPLTLLFTSENPNVEIQLWNFVNNVPVTKLDSPVIPINSEVTVDLPLTDMGDNRLCIVPINNAVIDKWQSDSQGVQGWKNWLFEASQKYLEWETFILDTSRYTNLSNTKVTFIIDIIGGASETNPPFNASYYLGKDELTLLSEFTFITFDSEGSVLVNKTMYINNLIMIPFLINPDYYPDKAVIKLGGDNTNIEAPILNDDLVSFDFGNIIIDDFKNSVLDYQGVSYELRLPYVDEIIEIPPSLIVNKTINVKMLVDVYTGDCTINIYNGDELPILSTKTKIGRSIPIRILEDSVNSLDGNSNINNELKKAQILRISPELVDSPFSNLINKVGLLSGVTGFIQVNNIQIEKNMSESENDLLINILSRGVFIK